MKIKIKRVYETPEKEDGERILVDRLWPRGLTKQKAAVDIWLKEIGPSTQLRKWFAHDAAKWIGFQQKYIKELSSNINEVSILKAHIKNGPVTLVYGARDQEHNEALVLKKWLEQEDEKKK
ncbi:MAG: DUF488 domain-containing protein [Bacteroidetes bacterium]|nr:DUF488 domain-containing protein [Bacteroidota bacterium]